MEPSRPAATLLLGAILSDTVILNSPTTTERDRAVIAYLERVLPLDAGEFGRRCSSRPPTSTPSRPRRSSRATRSSTTPAGGQTLRIAQVETVGEALARPPAPS